jgi:hypothetical protein
MSWTSGIVVSKLYDAVDATNRVDIQRLNQWIDILRQRPGDEEPPCSQDVQAVITRTLSMRDMSVEQPPSGKSSNR